MLELKVGVNICVILTLGPHCLLVFEAINIKQQGISSLLQHRSRKLLPCINIIQGSFFLVFHHGWSQRDGVERGGMQGAVLQCCPSNFSCRQQLWSNQNVLDVVDKRAMNTVDLSTNIEMLIFECSTSY